MTKIQKTAKWLDKLFHFIQVCISILFVVLFFLLFCIVGMYLVGFPQEFGNPAAISLNLGKAELILAPEYAPDTQTFARYLLIGGLFTLVQGFFLLRFIKALRQLIGTIKDGLPFHETAYQQLKNMAWLNIAMGLTSNVTNIFENIWITSLYDVPKILLSDKVVDVTVFSYSVHLSFLVYSGILFLLAYVFRYGAELQVQVDETL